MCVTRFILLFLLTIGHLGAITSPFDNEPKCPPSSQATAVYKLRSKVFKDYDQSVRPISAHTNKTQVNFIFLLNHFTYDDEAGTLGIYAWLTMYWKDPSLKWSPKEYDNITRFQAIPYEIWTPELVVHNGFDKPEYPNLSVYGIKCAVHYTGQVTCVPPVFFEALCAPDLSRYPFDTQNCTFVISSSDDKEVDDLNMNKVTDVDAASNQQWKITDINFVKNNYPIQINLKLKRVSGPHAASIVILCFVAAMLTFTSLSVSPLKRERLILCYINLIAQFLNVQNLSWIVPLRGDQVPFLLLFERDSLLMSVVLICFTVLFKNLMQKKSEPPVWISRIVSFIMGSMLGQFICLGDYSIRGAASFKNDDDDNEVIVNSETNTNSQDWEMLARCLDKLLLAIYVIVYVVMSVKLLP